MENGLKKRYHILRAVVTVFLALCIFNVVVGLSFTGLSLTVPGEAYSTAEITKPSDITRTTIQYFPESVQPVIRIAIRIILWASPFPHDNFSASNPPLHPKAALQIVLWTNLSVACLFGLIWLQLRKLLYNMTLKEPPLTFEHRKILHHTAILIVIVSVMPHAFESMIYTMYCKGSFGFSILDSLTATILLVIGTALYASTKNITLAKPIRRK